MYFADNMLSEGLFLRFLGTLNEKEKIVFDRDMVTKRINWIEQEG